MTERLIISLRRWLSPSVKHSNERLLFGHAVQPSTYEALQGILRVMNVRTSFVDKAQEETKKKSKQDLPKTSLGRHHTHATSSLPPSGASGGFLSQQKPPILHKHPPLPTSVLIHSSGRSVNQHTAQFSSKIAASAEYFAWTTTDTQIKPSSTTIPDDLYMDDETTTNEQAYSSGEEVGHDHIPTINLRQS
ncbi:hypothetical protein Tco_0897555 [Tanacetum coccineum]